jgi:hypothetical protein
MQNLMDSSTNIHNLLNLIGNSEVIVYKADDLVWGSFCKMQPKKIFN